MAVRDSAASLGRDGSRRRDACFLRGLIFIKIDDGSKSDRPLVDVVISLRTFYASPTWRQKVVEIASLLEPGGILLVRELFVPVRLALVGRLIRGAAMGFTWSSFVSHCRRCRLDLIALERTPFRAEAVFVRRQ